MKLYQCVSVCIKSQACGYTVGGAIANLTGNLAYVYEHLNKTEDSDHWERTAYEFPSMKQVTKADITIT